jgi:butyryl-CoA dehydrogenase
VSAAIVVEELGWGCGSTALAISAHNGLGLGPIVNFGAEAQKARWLPPLATGAGKLACLSLTEPGAGSDLQGGVRTTAVKAGDAWVINGSKMWMTNASISDLMVVLCRTDPAGGSRSLSHIVVPSDAPGVTIGPPEKMGLTALPRTPSALTTCAYRWIICWARRGAACTKRWRRWTAGASASARWRWGWRRPRMKRR